MNNSIEAALCRISDRALVALLRAMEGGRKMQTTIVERAKTFKTETGCDGIPFHCDPAAP